MKHLHKLLCLLIGLVSAEAVGGAKIYVYARSDFDGITPLHYATVDAGSDPLPLYQQNPKACLAVQKCTVIDHLQAGSPVAIAETNDAWSHVQFIGKTSISQGWAETAHLRPLDARLPDDEGPPGQQDRKLYWERWQIHVALVNGKDVPVCEAYLQRLNQSWFYEPPYCGRPENDQIPGFERMRSIALSPAEVNKLAVQAANLESMTGISFIQKVGALSLADSTVNGPVYLDTQDLVGAARPGDKMAVWRFDPRVDIDNDGIPDNVIMWRNGTPPVWDRCGESLSHGRIRMEGPTAFFLTPHNSAIDPQRTEAVFQDIPSVLNVPLRHSIGIFRYRGENYFDAFINTEIGATGDFYRPTEGLNYLHVFHAKAGKIGQICQFANSDVSGWHSN